MPNHHDLALGSSVQSDRRQPTNQLGAYCCCGDSQPDAQLGPDLLPAIRSLLVFFHHIVIRPPFFRTFLLSRFAAWDHSQWPPKAREWSRSSAALQSLFRSSIVETRFQPISYSRAPDCVAPTPTVLAVLLMRSRCQVHCEYGARLPLTPEWCFADNPVFA